MWLFVATHLLQITSAQLNIHDWTRPPYAFVHIVLVFVVIKLLTQALVAKGDVLKDVPVVDGAETCQYSERASQL